MKTCFVFLSEWAALESSKGQMRLSYSCCLFSYSFSNTDRGERAHELIKSWFHVIGAKPSELIPRMVNQ